MYLLACFVKYSHGMFASEFFSLSELKHYKYNWGTLWPFFVMISEFIILMHGY